MHQVDGKIKQGIREGRTALGIELGSTRIKAVLIGEDYTPLASGSHDWENRLENGLWTYHLDDVWAGVQSSFRKLCANVQNQYGLPFAAVGAIGVSAMMHGYLVFGDDGRQLAPFCTWRNTNTGRAVKLLSEEFNFNIPHRWSIAHLYEAILNGEEHVGEIAFITTLAGYVHWKLTGKKVLGVGDASGMFPIDSTRCDFDEGRMGRFDALIKDKGCGWALRDILPKVLGAGAIAGTLTEEGAKLLDPAGTLQPGAPLCPPEGDAGTGMVATNSVAECTGNVSAGTSIFAMVVLEKPLSKPYPEIDMVTTPAGSPVAMVHCNNCTSDLDAWVKLFAELLETLGAQVSTPALYDAFYHEALSGEADAGGLVSCNYYSGEPITGLEEGRPLLARLPDSSLSFANFARSTLFSAMATLKIGMDILSGQERVELKRLLGHGGLFKTKGVAQRLMAGALRVPVAVMESAGEGGAWGIALLAAYSRDKAPEESLQQYLENRVFAGMPGEVIAPQAEDTAGFERYMKRYTAGLAIERAAVDALPG